MKRSNKPIKAWMIQGPAGGVAPFYGWDFTRKGLLAQLERRGVTVIPDCQAFVRATVTVPPASASGAQK